jgi:hypothetical protein
LFSLLRWEEFKGTLGSIDKRKSHFQVQAVTENIFYSSAVLKFQNYAKPELTSVKNLMYLHFSFSVIRWKYYQFSKFASGIIYSKSSCLAPAII